MNGGHAIGRALARPIALPTLVIAESIIVGAFRKEWPAADCNPRQAAGDRIEPTLSCFGCSVA